MGDIYFSDGKKCFAFNIDRKDVRSILCPATGKVSLFAQKNQLFAIDFHTTPNKPQAWRKNHQTDGWLTVPVDVDLTIAVITRLQRKNKRRVRIWPTQDDNKFYTVGWPGERQVNLLSVSCLDRLTFNYLTDTTEKRSNPYAAAGHDGVLYVADGSGHDRDMEKYDPQVGHWARCADMPTKRADFDLLAIRLPSSVVGKLIFD